MLRILFFLPMLFIFLSSCQLNKPMAEPLGSLPKDGDREKGLISRSFPLTRLDEETKGYGLYTYVIFGAKQLDNESPEADPAVKRLGALLEAIDYSQLISDPQTETTIPHSQINLFCIPIKKSNKTANLDNYNAELSLLYRDIAIGALKKETAFLAKFSTSPGPFLVSTQQPLNQVREPQTVLFADLSTTNPLAMREVVSAYKQKVDEAVVSNTTLKFDPIKLRILTLILDADKNIKIMKDAVAAWRPAQ